MKVAIAVHLLFLLITSVGFAKDILCYIDNNCKPSNRAGAKANPSTGKEQ